MIPDFSCRHPLQLFLAKDFNSRLRVNENKQTEHTQKLMKGNHYQKYTETENKMQQCFQDNGRRPGLVEYAMWKSDTKSMAWVSSDVGIYLDSSPVSSYPNQITLYRSLHAHWRSILESTIQEILYSGSPSIMTRAGAGCILSEKMLDVVDSSMDIWKLDKQSVWTLEDGEWMIEY